MVIPLGQKAADDHGAEGRGPLRYGVAFAGAAARAAEGRRAWHAVLARAARAGRPSPPASVVLDVEIVVSELLTNAIRHAPGPCGVLLELSDTALSVTVWDTSAEPPVTRPRDERRIGGHGLHLVRALSERFTVARHPAGKQVTARLRLTAAPAGPSAGPATPAR